MTETTLKVERMSCVHYKAAVEEELDRLAGVKRSSADPPEGHRRGALRGGRGGDG